MDEFVFRIEDHPNKFQISTFDICSEGQQAVYYNVQIFSFQMIQMNSIYFLLLFYQLKMCETEVHKFQNIIHNKIAENNNILEFSQDMKIVYSNNKTSDTVNNHKNSTKMILDHPLINKGKSQTKKSKTLKQES